MILVQSIPFWVMLTMTFINLKIKKRFFCISTLSLSYLTLAMLGSIFLVLRPRTGWPYVRLDAILFLTVCYVMFSIPALLFKDGKKSDGMEFLHISDNTIQKITDGLIFLTVPTAVYAAVIAIPNIIKFFQLGGNRGAFRNQLTDPIRGFSSPSHFLLLLGLSFCLIAVFWMTYCVIFRKINTWRIILLTFGPMGKCIFSLHIVSRASLFFYMVYIAICVILLQKFIPSKHKKGLRKYAVVVALFLFVPFALISFARFKEGIIYSVGSYFATGPYSFNADYAARVDGKIKPLNGYLTIGWHQFIFDKIAGTNYYKNAEMYSENYFFSGDSQRGNSPEIDHVYRHISGAFPGEFGTFVGFTLKDYPLYLGSLLLAVISAIFCLIIYFDKKQLWQTYFATIYFYILLTSTMHWPFLNKRGAFELFLTIVFGILLYFVHKKENKSNDKTQSSLSNGL